MQVFSHLALPKEEKKSKQDERKRVKIGLAWSPKLTGKGNYI